MRRRPATRGGRGGIRDCEETGDASAPSFFRQRNAEKEHPSSLSRSRGTCCNYRDNRGGADPRRPLPVNERLTVTLARQVCYRKSACVGIIV